MYPGLNICLKCWAKVLRVMCRISKGWYPNTPWGVADFHMGPL